MPDPKPWATGSCACGELSYALASAPIIVHACHCRDCQRLNAAPFVVNLWIEGDRFELRSGTLVETPLTSGTDAGQRVYTSACCGTRIGTRYLRAPNDLFVRGMTLDDPSELVPDVHIFVRSKVPWLPLPEGARSFDGLYDLTQVWDEQMLARRKASRAKTDPPPWLAQVRKGGMAAPPGTT